MIGEIVKVHVGEAQGVEVKRIVAPTRMKREPVIFVLGVLLAALGAIGGAWLFMHASDAQTVVMMRNGVDRGQLIQQADLMTVRVGVDPALKTVNANEIGKLVGKRAANDLEKGSLLTPTSVTDEMLPNKGQSLIAIPVSSDLLPAEDLRSGDKVRIVAVPTQGQAAPTFDVVKIKNSNLVVVRVMKNQNTNKTVVTLQVPDSVATDLVVLSGAANVGLVLETRER